MKFAVIVNPAAGGGVAGRRWPEAQCKLAQRIGAVKALTTRGPGDAERLARELAEAGCEIVIAAGGDGTLNEVVNGVMVASRQPAIAVFPLGSGADFARTLRLRGLESAIEMIARGESRPMDVLLACYRRFDGTEAQRWCVNIASFGLGAAAIRRMPGWRQRLPSAVSYLSAAVPELASGRSYRVTLTLDGVARETSATTVAIANGQYQGAGIHIAPRAELDDGQADITVVETVGLAEVLRHIRILYSGEIYSHRKVRHARAARIRVDGSSDIPVELDGDPVGTLPLEVEVRPGALRVLAPSLGFARVDHA